MPLSPSARTPKQRQVKGRHHRINIVVTGGETNGHFSLFMGSPMRAKFRADPDSNATVSIDAWR